MWRIAIAAAFFIAVLAVAFEPASATAIRRTTRPAAAAPTNTPRPDLYGNGYPEPSPVPSCVAGGAFSYKDANGCVYVCSGGKTTIISRAISGVCAQPTTGATATPTPTVTATP